MNEQKNKIKQGKVDRQEERHIRTNKGHENIRMYKGRKGKKNFL
jgi:hypothetical protein